MAKVKHTIFGMIFFIVLMGCSKPQFTFMPSEIPEYLQICMHIDEEVPVDLAYKLEDALEDFIREYQNQPNSFFNLKYCFNSEERALNIFVDKSILATTKDQVRSTLLTTVGVGVPLLALSMGIEPPFAYYEFPYSRTWMVSEFSQDLSRGEDYFPYSLETWAYLSGKERQIRRQKNAFKDYLHTKMQKIEEVSRSNSMESGERDDVYVYSF